MQNGMCAFAPVPGERDAYRCRGGRVVRTRTLPIWSRCDCRIELSTLAQSGDPRADRRPVPQADVLAAAKTAACQYLGEEVGRRPCDSCRGRVLVKKFACRHPAHERTTLAQCAACPDYVPSPGLPAAAVLAAAKTASGENRRSILLRFPHGLGDAVQLTAVLLHLRAVHPGVGIDVACKVGQHTLLAGLARRAFVLGREPPEAYEPHQYDLIRTLAWHEPERCYADSPSTKAEKCLREVLGIAPREDLCRYEIAPGPEATARARQYADSIGRPYVLIHYQGNSASRHKNLDERTVAALGRRIAAHGHAAVVLDWDRRSGLVDERNVLCPGADHALWNGTGTGDGATLAALVQLAAWCVGIDSGPGHVFAATVRSPPAAVLAAAKTAAGRAGGVAAKEPWDEAPARAAPAAIVMVQNHPLHYFGLADHVTHLVPDDHARFLRGDAAAGARYFESHYNFRVYRDLERTLCRLCDEVLGGQTNSSGRGSGDVAVALRKTKPHHAERDGYFDTAAADLAGLMVDGDCFVRREHRRADMVIVRDVYLDDCYRLEELPRRPRFAVDVGAHVGTAALRLRRRSSQTRIACVEANAANLAALLANVGDFAHVIHAACTYEPGPIALLSTVYPGTENTGGSGIAVVPDASPADTAVWQEQFAASPYRLADAPEKITLEEIARRCGFPHIDLVKLDCEGSEISILEHCDLALVRLVVGEYHDRERFCKLLARRFAGWNVRWIKDGPSGLFWLWRDL